MKTLIVVATHKELQLLLDKADKITSINSHLATYSVNGKLFDLLCTGVGMVATAFHLGATLTSISYDCVINAGIAGSFDKNFPLGTVVQVVEDQFSEMGAEDDSHFLSLTALELILPNDFPFESGVLSNTQEFYSLRYPKVSAITVNTVHGSTQRIAKTQARLNPQIESMEGAAFFYACKSLKVPCVQIRSISNYVELRNKAAWNIPLAVQNLNQEILSLLS